VNVSPAESGNVEVSCTDKYGTPKPVSTLTHPIMMVFAPTSYPATLTEHLSCIDLNSYVTSKAIPKPGYKFDHWVSTPSMSDFRTKNNPSTFQWDINDNFSTWTVKAYFVQSGGGTAPVANAGVDQTVNTGALVKLDGSGSYDPGGGALTYKWTQTGGNATVALSGDTTAKPTFTAPQVPVNGDTLKFLLTVTNNQALSSTDTVSIKIKSSGSSLLADAGPDQSVKYGHTVTLDGTNSTSSGSAITGYEWTIVSASSPIDISTISISNSTSAIASFVAPYITGWIQVRLMVRSSTGSQAYDAVTINIVPVDTGDAPTANAGPDQVVMTGSVVQLDGSGSTDPDDGIRLYEWFQKEGPPVEMSGSNEFDPSHSIQMNPTFTAPAVTSGKTVLKFELTVIDNQDFQDVDEVLVNVVSQAYADASRPPVADAGPDQMVDAGASVTLNASNSSDPEGKIFSYHWDVVSGPDSVALWEEDVKTPVFLAPLEPGSATIQLTVTDDAAHADTDEVQVSWENEPPVADAGSDQSVEVGEHVTLDGSASSDADDGIDSFKWTQISGPTVALADSGTENPSFTAPSITGATVDLTFQLTVEDKGDQSSSDQVKVTVTNRQNPPTAGAGDDQSVKETTLVTLNGTGSSDPDDDIQSYSWIQLTGGPAVALSNSNTATPTFYAPSISGPVVLNFQLTVRDAGGRSDTDTVKISVYDNGASPVANAGVNQTVFNGDVVTLDGSGSSDPDGTIQRYHWSQVSGPTVTLSSDAAIRPTFVAPENIELQSDLVFDLEVFDNDGLRSVDEVVITERIGTEPPMADAGPDQTVDEEDMVVLDGSASSDPDDGIKSYHWDQVSGVAVVFSDPSSQKPTFEAPKVSEDSSLTFKLTVEDESGRTSSDETNVTVENKSGGGGGGCFISTIGH
jgi:hypothetical protein